MTGVPVKDDFQHLLDKNGITSLQAATRNKELAKLGDPLTNLIFSLAHSLALGKFSGEKVSGKILAQSLHLADFRHLAPSRLDAHGLGDCVEAIIAYAWIRGSMTISEAVRLLSKQLQNIHEERSKGARSERIAIAFAALLQFIYEKEQD